MSSHSIRDPQTGKKLDIFAFWFCSKCLERITMEDAPKETRLDYDSPNELSRDISYLGLKLICKKCGSNSFVIHEFAIPTQDLVEAELKKQLDDFIRSNLNPSRKRPEGK